MLTQYAQHNPTETWEAFKNVNAGADAKAVRNIIFSDQGGLCAYCETYVGDLPDHKQRVEHYHGKADVSNPAKNWALDWNNLIGVCIGGEDAQTQLHPLPENLSCDAHKNHLCNLNKLPVACEGYLINPLLLQANPNLLKFDKATGRLYADLNACAQVTLSPNQIGSTEGLINTTIQILNLNCQRLCDNRLEVLKSYNQEIKKARMANNSQIFSQLAQHWFQEVWPSFFTTRRILLGQHAEAYLQHISYNG